MSMIPDVALGGMMSQSNQLQSQISGVPGKRSEEISRVGRPWRPE